MRAVLVSQVLSIFAGSQVWTEFSDLEEKYKRQKWLRHVNRYPYKYNHPKGLYNPHIIYSYFMLGSLKCDKMHYSNIGMFSHDTTNCFTGINGKMQGKWPTNTAGADWKRKEKKHPPDEIWSANRYVLNFGADHERI